MAGSRALLAMVLGVAILGCGTAASPSQSTTPSGSPSPAATVVGSPTPGPLSVEEAGAALLAAEGRLNTAWAALQDAYYLTAPCAWTSTPCNEAEMPAGKDYWGTLASALSRYIDELETIRFPDVVAPDAVAHIEATGQFRDLALAASEATTVSTFNTRAAEAADARDTTYGIQELKDALGLPVGP